MKVAQRQSYATQLGNVVRYNSSTDKWTVMFHPHRTERIVMLSYDSRAEAIEALTAIEKGPAR